MTQAQLAAFVEIVRRCIQEDARIALFRAYTNGVVAVYIEPPGWMGGPRLGFFIRTIGTVERTPSTTEDPWEFEEIGKES